MTLRLAGALALIFLFPGTASAARLQLLFPLVADDAGLQRFADAVSTPGSPRYGQYEPVATLAHRFGASAARRAVVARYLRSIGAGAVRVSPTGMSVEAEMSVGLAERTFATRLRQARAVGGQRFLTPRDGVRLPAALRTSTLGVVGLDTRPVVRPRAAGPPPSAYRPVTGTPGGCAPGVATGGFTPNQYLAAYDYSPLQAAGLRGQGERVALIEIDGFKRADLTTFARCFGLRVPPVNVYGVGISHRLKPGPEATLDLEVLGAAAPGARAFEVFESTNNAVAVNEAFTAPLFAPGIKPQVVSASLGVCELDMAAAFGAAGVAAVNRNLALAAATGITTVVASGDNGSSDCSDSGGSPIHALAADFPSVSPWVTSIGGTNLRLDAGNQISTQEVWNDTSRQLAAGGGGLSQLFYRPSYQKGVVAPNRRAVPDLGMLADVAPGYATYCSAHRPGCRGWRTVGGTSAAAPLVAGGMALVDQDLHRHGREFIGLANSLLYSIGRSPAAPSVFSDVTTGSNDLGQFIPAGGGMPLGCCSSNPGFDWATGWGGLDLAHFDQVALTMLPQIADVRLSIPRPQQPVRRGRLAMKVSCSGRCTAVAFGFISITPGGRTLSVHSSRYHLRGKGSKRVLINFSPTQQTVLRSALARHRRIEAELFGAALDATGAPGRVTAGKLLPISG